MTFEIRWGAFDVASGQYMSITAAEFLGGFFPQMSTWLLGRLVDFQQDILHFLSPPVTVLLPCSLQFAQVMGIAERVQTIELKVWRPVIVTESATEVGQNTHGFHRLATTIGVGKEQGP